MWPHSSPRLIELNRDALLKSFWWKNSFIKFLRRMPISEYTLTSFRQDESKRVWLDLRFGLDPEGVGVRFQPVQQPREGVMGRGRSSKLILWSPSTRAKPTDGF